MLNQRLSLIGLLVLQIIAVLIYPPAFFQRAPQAAVLPPALLILFSLAIVGMNSSVLTPDAGRNSLAFIQGINIVVRMMMLLPNLLSADGSWNWLLLIAQVIGIGLSWFTITQMEKLRLRALLLRNQA